MQVTATPYLAVLRSQLATTLRPTGDDTARQVGMYSHRILTQLLLYEQLLPQLRQEALARLAALYDELAAELKGINGGRTLAVELDQHLCRTPDYTAAEPLVQEAMRLLSTMPSERAHRLMGSTAAILRALHDAFHEAVLAHELPPAEIGRAEQEPLDAAQKAALTDFLRQRLGDAGVNVGKTKAVVGGGSKQTVFVELQHAVTLPTSIVLRIDKSTSPVGSSVADEFDILRTVFDAGLPVPHPYALDAKRDIVGAPFIVMSRIDGHNIGDALDVAEPSRSFGISLARAMAQLHAIPLERAPARLPGMAITTRERMLQDIAEFEGKWRSLGEPLIALELAYAWLKSHLDFAEGRRSIVHRDIGCHNMLAKNDVLVGLLDWETAVAGNPAQDLAYVYHTAIQIMPWAEFLGEYLRAGGSMPHQHEIDFYRVWRAVWLVGFQLLARSYFLSGLTSEMILAYASQYWYQRCEQNLHEVVDMAYSRY